MTAAQEQQVREATHQYIDGIITGLEMANTIVLILYGTTAWDL